MLDRASEVVRAAAGRLPALIGHDGPALGQTLQALIGQSVADLTGGANLRPGQEPLFLGSLRLGPALPELDILGHERGDQIIIELEPSLQHRPSAARLLARLRSAVARIKRQDNVADACRTAAAEVRSFTGHDRALVYQFLSDWSGKVIGEDGTGALPSLINQHFPATDIPSQARALYRRDLIRVIPHVCYEPAPMVPQEFADRFDMSDCSLRSVSPFHVQYLRNMDVASSMSVSILRGTELWGLIACHGRGSRLVPYEIREACKQIGAALTQQVETLEARWEMEKASRLAIYREQLLAKLAGSSSVEVELRLRADEIKRVVPADGLILHHNGLVTTSGVVPDDETCRALAEWSRRKDATPPYSTACLRDAYAPAAAATAEASGLLSITASQEDPIDILWLRKEYAGEVETHGPLHPGCGEGSDFSRVGPAASFTVWRNAARGCSLPWTELEIEAAHRLRRGIERIRERQRVSSLQASLIHMSRVNAMGAMASSIAHELNQPLTATASYTRSAAKMLAMGTDRAEVVPILERATEQALRAGEIIRQLRQLVAPVEAAIGPCSLSSIIDGACSIGLLDAPRLGIEVSISYDRDLQVFADKIQIQQVLLNLIRNAFEAMEKAAVRQLSVVAAAEGDSVRISVADTGSGVCAATRERLFSAFNSDKEGGLGIGLSICRTIVEAHGGKIWLEEDEGSGARFSFLLHRAPPEAA